MDELVQHHAASRRNSDSLSCPRRIFMLWFQGWENAPHVVQRCALSWRERNPTWTVEYLDRQAIQNWVPRWWEQVQIKGDCEKRFTRQNRSDFIRMALLLQHGGVWADATTFCCRPLDEWLRFGGPDPFFAFRNDGRDSSKPCSNWFLAADRDSEILNAWWVASIQFWTGKQKAHDYYWHHHTLRRVVQQNDSLYERLRAALTLSNHPPHLFHRLGFAGAVTDEIRTHVIEQRAPLYKLTWRQKSEQSQRVQFLFNHYGSASS